MTVAAIAEIFKTHIAGQNSARTTLGKETKDEVLITDRSEPGVTYRAKIMRVTHIHPMDLGAILNESTSETPLDIFVTHAAPEDGGSLVLVECLGKTYFQTCDAPRTAAGLAYEQRVMELQAIAATNFTEADTINIHPYDLAELINSRPSTVFTKYGSLTELDGKLYRQDTSVAPVTKNIV